MSVPAKIPAAHESPASQPGVLVSVLSYNSTEDTIATVRHLQRQTYSRLHLQVVDNASPNNSAKEIARAFPDLHIRVLPKNLGYTGGGNVVLKQALTEGYDYVVLCNHDIEVDERAIERLVETAEAHGDAGVVGGIELNLATGEQRAGGGGRYNPWLSRMRWLNQSPFNDEASLRVECVHGALVMFTRRALHSGIFLDEELFMYLDEIDIGFQLKRKGLQAYTDRRVVVRHKSAPYQLDEYVGYLSQRNRLYTVKKYGLWYHRVFYNLYAVLFELPIKVLFRTLQGYPRFARACVIGHLDAMRGRMGRGQVDEFLGRYIKSPKSSE